MLNKKKKNKSKKYNIVSWIIVLISLGAFSAGLIQTFFLGNITDRKAEINDLEADHERMESMATSLRILDREHFYKSSDYADEAKIKDYEFWQLNDTLTDDERKVYVHTIITRIQQSFDYRSRTSIIRIYRHFNKSTADYSIATKQIEGYGYKITWEMWQSYLSIYGPAIYEVNASETYDNFFSYDYIQSRPLDERPRDRKSRKEIFFNVTDGFLNITDYFLSSPVISLQDEINQKLIELDKLEACASRIALGVAFTTLAVVIYGVIADRISVIEDRDRISIIFLLFATVMCILGWILPYLLTIF